MSDYEFSVDDILDEFYKDLMEEDSSNKQSNPLIEQPIPEAPHYEKRVSEAPSYNEPSYEDESLYIEHQTVYVPKKAKTVTEDSYVKEKAPVKSKAAKNDTYDDLFFDDEDGEEKENRPKKYTRKKKEKPIYDERPVKDGGKSVIKGFVGLICAVFGILLIAWVGVNVHPESETMTYSKTNTKTDLSSRLETYSNNSKVDVLSSIEEIAEQAVIKKHYTIPEDQLVAPKPNQANYGTVSISEAASVMDVIEKAKQSGLYEDGEEPLFSPDANFYWDSNIQYYYDETILVICWKEQIEQRVTSLVEVKIADGSQIRRKVCEDTYGSSVYMYCSELAEQANAVVAMNSDYYAFRDLGITCYDRTVYRFNEYSYYGMYKAYNVTDTLFINGDGDFVFFKRGTETTKEAVQQWVDDNNLLYSIAFGPILVENYETVEITDYPVGEITSEYSRAGIGQIGHLHYLYMAVSHSNESTPRCTVIQFAQMFKDKGVMNAYCLDGGQTGEVYFNGAPFNHIDFGNERTVSDILYFATALGEEAQS